LKGLFILVVLLGFYNPSALTQTEELPKIGYAKKDGVNIRTDSTIYSQTLGSLKKGQQVKIIKENLDWYKIEIPKDTVKGYVYGDYVEKSGNTYYTTGDNLNIRSNPELTGNIIGRLKKDTNLSVFGETDKFLIIDPYPNAFAWVHKKLISTLSVATEPTKNYNQSQNMTTQDSTVSNTQENQTTDIDSSPEKTIKGKFKKHLWADSCGIKYYLLENNKKISLKINNLSPKDLKLFLNKEVSIQGEEFKTSTCPYLRVIKIEESK